MKAKFVYEKLEDIFKPKSEEEIMKSLRKDKPSNFFRHLKTFGSRYTFDMYPLIMKIHTILKGKYYKENIGPVLVLNWKGYMHFRTQINKKYYLFYSFDHNPEQVSIREYRSKDMARENPPINVIVVDNNTYREFILNL